MRVIRLFISLLCALGLALSPVGAASAAPAPAAMADCAMKGDMPAKPADGGKMSCCTPACQAPAPSVLLPEPERAANDLTAKRDLLVGASAEELKSLLRSGLDPPPRLPS